MIELINEHQHKQQNQNVQNQQHQHQHCLCHPRRQTQGVNKGQIITILKKQKEPKVKKKSYETPHELYNANLVKQSLQQSLNLIPPFISLFINQKIKLAQDQTYLAILGQQKPYLKRLYEDGGDSKFIKQAVTDLVNGLTQNIEMQIQQGNYNVHHRIRLTKEQLLSGEPPSKISQLKQKLKGNLINFKSQIQIQPTSFMGQSKYQYSINSQKNKKAEKFVQRMNQTKAERLKRLQKVRLEQQKMEVQSMKQRMQFQERIKKQKHEELKIKYLQKRKKKQQYFEQIKKNDQQFKLFKKIYKEEIPLYKKKQNQFYKNFVLVENKKKLQILTKIKEQKKPIELLDIKQHSRRYKEHKVQQEEQRQATLQLVMKQRNRPIKKYYKGKFYQSLEKKNDSKLFDSSDDQDYDRSQIQKKMLQYNAQIKRNYMPKISQQKQKQLKQLIQQMKWLEKSKTKAASINSKQEGKKNLQRLHQLIAQLRAKGKVKPQSDYNTIQSTKPNYPNYLKDLKNNKMSNSFQNHNIDYEAMALKNPQWTTIQAKKFEQHAKRRQKFLKNSKSIDIETYMQQKNKLDFQYLSSAKAKIAILNQLE